MRENCPVASLGPRGSASAQKGFQYLPLSRRSTLLPGRSTKRSISSENGTYRALLKVLPYLEGSPCEGNESNETHQLKLTISILIAVVASVLAARPAFAVTCAVDCNLIRGPLGRV